MKTQAMIIGAALSAINAQANLIPLSSFRNISISGTAIDESYSDSRSSTSLGSFNQTVSNSVTDTDSEGTIYQALGQVHQTSLITNDSVFLSTNMFAETEMIWRFPASLHGTVGSEATSTFAFTFALADPSNLTLLGSGSTPTGFQRNVPDSVFDLRLTSLDGPIFSTHSFLIIDPLAHNPSVPASISVLPGIYTLQVTAHTFAVPDPLGDLAMFSTDLTMRATSVPEVGSTLILMLGGLAVLIIGVRKYETDEH
jgi:hypothetical protein